MYSDECTNINRSWLTTVVYDGATAKHVEARSIVVWLIYRDKVYLEMHYLNGFWDSLDLCLGDIKTRSLYLPKELYSVEDPYLQYKNTVHQFRTT